ncbi:MAG: EndoU domain-containing protein [Leptolyngbya sp. Prado105]|jgi:hypothetical protein|nr:EndoU domain-containing protein [Leptolyngbya sp. Prado105]
MKQFFKVGLVGSWMLLLGVTIAWQSVLAQPTQIEYQTRKKQPRPVRSNSTRSQLLPFFDLDNNPVRVGVPRNRQVDITPPAPQLNEFDRKVLATCGEFGSSVGTVSLRRLFAESPEVVQSIKTAVGGEIFPGRRSDQQFQDDLLAIWANRKGFEHIFCGEIRGAQKIGGLHYAGRYWQLQQAGIAGRLPNNSRSEEVVEGEIYTLGVEVRQGNRVIRDAKKGYSYVSDAQELLTDATVAFKHLRSNSTSDSKSVCLFTVRDASVKVPFKAVFVKTQRGIVTFYPDATPSNREASCDR